MTTFKLWLESIDSLESKLKQEHPELDKLVLFDNDDAIQIHSIEVSPDHRGKGIGTEVINKIKQYADEKGKPIVLTAQPQPRKKAVLDRFYKKAGFKRPKSDKDFSLPRHTHIYK